jgi:hypothetical protein
MLHKIMFNQTAINNIFNLIYIEYYLFVLVHHLYENSTT